MQETDWLALLALWMFGQVNPVLPLLGNVFISEASRKPFAAQPQASFDWWESGAVTLNLLMLGTLMMTLLRVPRNLNNALLLALGAVVLAKFITAALLLKSWALLLWINSEAMLGMLLGVVLLGSALSFRRIWALRFGAAVALTYLIIVNLVLDNSTPSAATSIYHWRYGHLLNYNGLAQTITLVFPALLFHLWRTWMSNWRCPGEWGFLMSYYDKHVFFCTNQRTDGSACCNDHAAQKARDYVKNKVKELGISSHRNKIRINSAGCMDRCDDGPVIVVYPEGIWYTYVDEGDLDEIITEHLQHGRVVERLKI